MLNGLFGLFSHDVAIDLGTANTLVAVRGKGIVIREPSFVARQKRTKEIIAIGKRAKQMLGKTPPTLEVIRPLKDGVIADFDATTKMLSYFIRVVHSSPRNIIPKIPKPRIVVGIPSGVTPVERRAVADAALSAGAREVMLIEEPLAAAIGANLPITSSVGSMIVDIGAGTTEIAVISLGGIVLGRSLRIAGDKLDQAIINYCRLKYSLVLGEATGENLKIELGSAFPQPKETVSVVRGRDLESGLPRSLRISDFEVREALLPIVQGIAVKSQEVIEETPPELVGDLMENGIILTGGGSLLSGVDKLFAEVTKLPIVVASDPLTTVVLGCSRILEDSLLAKRVRVTGRI